MQIDDHGQIPVPIGIEYEIKHPPPPTVMSGAKAMIFGSGMNILLVCVPFTFLSQGLGWPNSLTFIFSLIAICPLAERLGFVTEQLAMHTNETIGGLLNVTFGNATELIVALSALFKEFYRVVQLTLLGSVLSNLLLVLGCAFYFGGLRYKEQKYARITSQVNMTLLMLSVMGLLFPTVLTSSIEMSFTGDLGFSRCTSIMLLLMYLTYLYFQLFSHRHLYEDVPTQPPPSPVRSIQGPGEIEMSLMQAEGGGLSEELVGGSRLQSPPPHPNPNTSPDLSINDPPATKSSNRTLTKSGRQELANVDAPEVKYSPAVDEHASASGGDKEAESSHGGHNNHEEEDDEEEEDLLGFWPAIAWLAAITILISFLSDALVSTIEAAAVSWGVSSLFLSSIVIPIVGNAAEHAGAVMFARKNKCDLAISIAIGSSTQIALMVMPILVLISWMGGLHLTLDFQPYEASTLFLTVVTVAFVTMDGRSSYLVGAALVSAYIIVSAGFFAHRDENLKE